MANANVFAQFAQPVRSVVDYQNDYAKADALKNQNALQSLSLQQAANVQTQRNALRDLVQNGGTDLTTPAGQAQAISIAPDVAPALVKSVQDGITSGATAKKDTAQAGNFDADAAGKKQDTSIAAHQQHLQALSMVNTPEDAVGWMVQGVKDGTLPAQGLQGALQALQTNGVDAWKAQTMQSGESVQQQLEMTAAKPTEVKLGNVTKFIDTNPRSKTFGTEVVPAQAVGVSPDTVANNQTSIATNAATNATSRQNNQATIGKDYKVAGLDGQGNMIPFAATPGAPPAPGAPPPVNSVPGASPAATAAPKNPLQGIVDSIGTYQTGEGVALSRVPAMQKGTVLEQVKAQYPDYNEANFAGIHKTIGSMAGGPLGNMTRSINVVQTHLDALGGLIDKMDNGDIQVVNKARNYFQTQTGQTAPTNLAAAKQLIMGEVANVVAAGASTQGDRQTAEDAINSAGSPAQLKGVINDVIRPLMAGKLQGLEQQYKAGTAGRSDFRTKYLSPAAAASLNAVAPAAANPADADLHSAADAILRGSR